MQSDICGEIPQVYFFYFYCVLRIMHLNYNEKSTFKFIGDLVKVICNNGHSVNQSIEECLFAFYFVKVKPSRFSHCLSITLFKWLNLSFGTYKVKCKKLLL